MEEYELNRRKPISRWVVVLLVLLGLASAGLFIFGRVLYGILALICFVLILRPVLRQHRINREIEDKELAEWREEYWKQQAEERRQREEEERRRQEERKQNLEQLGNKVATFRTSDEFLETYRLVDALDEEDEEQKAQFKDGMLARLEQLVESNHTVPVLESLDYIASQLADDVERKRRVENMMRFWWCLVDLHPLKVQHVATKGRPCFYTGQVYQIQRKKRGNEFYYDESTAKPVTFFIYKDFFEWLTDDEFHKLAIKNIVNMTIDARQSILTLKPSTKEIFFFCGRKVEFIKCVIDKLQMEITKSW